MDQMLSVLKATEERWYWKAKISSKSWHDLPTPIYRKRSLTLIISSFLQSVPLKTYFLPEYFLWQFPTYRKKRRPEFPHLFWILRRPGAFEIFWLLDNERETMAPHKFIFRKFIAEKSITFHGLKPKNCVKLYRSVKSERREEFEASCAQNSNLRL